MTAPQVARPGACGGAAQPLECRIAPAHARMRKTPRRPTPFNVEKLRRDPVRWMQGRTGAIAAAAGVAAAVGRRRRTGGQPGW